MGSRAIVSLLLVAPLALLYPPSAASDEDAPAEVVDPDLFLASYRTQEAQLMNAYSFHGTLQRPAIAMEAANETELTAYAATHSKVLEETILRWELIAWDTPSYAESVAAVQSFSHILPDAPAQISRISIQSTHSDVVSVRQCSWRAVSETIQPDGTIAVSNTESVVAYEVHDAGASAPLHFFEKILKATGVGYARLLKRVTAVDQAPDGMLAVNAIGALSNMSEALGSWALLLEPIGDSYIVRSASYTRLGAGSPSFTILTNGTNATGPFPIAQAATIRYLTSTGNILAEYVITTDGITPDFDSTLRATVMTEQASRISASILDAWDYRAGDTKNTVYRNGVPTP